MLEGSLNPNGNRCLKCNAYLGAEDRFCKFCGTPRGSGGDDTDWRAGIPTERRHTCQFCGHTWSSAFLAADEIYCPQCGQRTSVVNDLFDYMKGMF